MKSFMPHPIPVAICCAALFASLPPDAVAQELEPEELAALLQTLALLQPGTAAAETATAEAPRLSMKPGGILRSIGAPPGHHFPPNAGSAGLSPEVIAHRFMIRANRLFGVRDTDADYTTTRDRSRNGRHYIRLQQTYRNVPVVAAEVVVQVNVQGGVEAILSDLAAMTDSPDPWIEDTVPVLSADEAAAAARAAFPTIAKPDEIESTRAVLAILDPAVLDEAGVPELVWDMTVFTADRSRLHYRVLISAVSSAIVRAWTLNHDALSRQVSDKNSNPTGNAMVVRFEGQLPTGIADVDAAYDYLGHTYFFYDTWHGRDGYDDAGATNLMTVRYCDTNNPCPWGNASAGPPMLFGNGYAVQDVVAHEFTHLVTASESGLIYTNQSGAINESLSDVWGEFVDLIFLGGDDSPGVRWDLGEDLPTGRIRSMSFPTNELHPDRLMSPYFIPPSNTADNGGVHTNSGVNNKLCYLLTDGDEFNGQSIHGLGLTAVAELYYEAQVNLLLSGSGWTDLYNALTQAAVNLGWSVADRNNLHRACQAVEIAVGAPVYVDRFAACQFSTGYPICYGEAGPYLTVAEGVVGPRIGDIVRIQAGSYNEPMTIDKILTLEAVGGPVVIGQ